MVAGMAELVVEMSLEKVEVSKGASTSVPMLVSSSSLLVMSPTTSFGGTSVSTLLSSIESVSIAELWVVVVGSGFSSTSFGKTNFFSLLDIFPENFDLVLALAEEVLSSTIGIHFPIGVFKQPGPLLENSPNYFVPICHAILIRWLTPISMKLPLTKI